MVTLEFPKDECRKTKYEQIKKCVLKRESGELSEECKKIFKDANVID
jgi:hypothetical protein